MASVKRSGRSQEALNLLLDHELDFTGPDARFRNDDTGAPAYPPAVPLQLILFTYSRSTVGSREIERAERMGSASIFL